MLGDKNDYQSVANDLHFISYEGESCLAVKEEDKLSKQIKSILKDPPDRVAKSAHSKSVRWKRTNHVRVVTKTKVIEQSVTSSTAFYSFLKKQGAYDPTKPGGHEKPASKFSCKPKDVKEVGELIAKGKNLSRKRIEKNHDRLEIKLAHVFSSRSRTFKNEIKSYLNEYKELLKA